MAEDEPVDVMALQGELAERLGVTSINKPVETTTKHRARHSHSFSPSSGGNKKQGTKRRAVPVLKPPPVHKPIPELEPFLHMLPELHAVDPTRQRELYHILFDIGVKAYLHLQKFLGVSHALHAGARSTPTTPVPPVSNGVATVITPTAAADGVAALAAPSPRSSPNNLERAGSGSLFARMSSHDNDTNLTDLDFIAFNDHLEQALETLRAFSLGPEDQSLVVDTEMAASAVNAFALASFRRPPTRCVENLMAPSQESATQNALSDSDRNDGLDADDGAMLANEDGLYSLACFVGYYDLAKMLIEMRGTPDFDGDIDCTPLMEASSAGNLDIVRLLLGYNIDVNTLSATQNTALIYAAAAGHDEVICELLTTGQCNLEQRNDNGHDALMEASSAGHLEVVKMLHNAGSECQFLNMNGDFKESALTLAAYKGHAHVVKFLLTMQHGDTFDEELHTALMECSMDGHVDVAELLLAAGAPVNMASESFESPLTLACCGGHADLAVMLLNAGANIEEPNDENYTPLMEAAREGHADVVRVLLDRGANVDMQTEETGETALTVAACSGHIDVIKTLLDYGGNLELGGNTPLMEAAQEGHNEAVKFILERMDRGSDKAMTSLNMAFVLAAENGHADVVQTLFLNGAEVNFEADGRTALMRATKNGYTEIANYLIIKGADVNFRSSLKDATALSIACAGGQKDIAKSLLTVGADPNIELKDGVTCVLEAARSGHVELVELMLDYSGIAPTTTANTGSGSGAKGNSAVPPPPPPTPTQNAKITNRRSKKAAAPGIAKSTQSVPITLGQHAPADQPIRIPQTMTEKQIADWTKDYYQWIATLIRNPEGDRKAGDAADATSPPNTLLAKLQAIQQQMMGSGLPNASFLEAAAKYPDVTPEMSAMELENLARFIATEAPAVDSQEKFSAFSEATYAKVNEFVARISALSVAEMANAKANAGTTGTANVKPPAQRKGSTTTIAAADSTTGNAAANVASPKRAQPPAATTTTVTTAPGGGTPPSSTQMFKNLRKNFPGLPIPSATTAPGGNASMGLPMSAGAAFEAGVASSISSALSYMQNPQDPHHHHGRRRNPAGSGGHRFPPPGLRCSGSQARVPPGAGGGRSGWNLTLECHQLHLPLRETLCQEHMTRRQTRIKNEILERLRRGRELDPEALAARDSDEEFCEFCNVAETAAAMAAFVAFHPDDAPSMPNYSEQLMEKCPMVWDTLSEKLTDAEVNLLRERLNTYMQMHDATRPVVLDRVTLEQWIRKHRSKTELTEEDFKRIPADQIGMLKMLCASEMITRSSMNASSGASEQFVTPSEKNAGATPAPRESHAAAPTPSLRRAHSEGEGVETTKPPVVRTVCDVDKATESNNDTALTLACSNGHHELVGVLVSRGSNIEHRDKKGFTPLILAATGGHVRIVELLLNHGAQIEAQSERTKDTALSLACSGGRKEVVELLLLKGANKEHRNVSDYTPLSLAASGGYVDIVNMLLDAGAEINSRTGSKLGISPLMLSAMNGHREATKVLLERGSDINAQIETNKNTALTLACFQGRTDVVRLLLSYAANVEHRAKTGLTPLMEAANGGYVEVGELLLEAGADPNTSPVPSSRDTALTIAADKGHEKFVTLVLNRGASIDAKNKKGCTALWLACHGGHIETVQTLVNRLADVDSQDNRKVTPLMIAFRKGHAKVVKFLVGVVHQFPNDSELDRYISTVSEEELIKNCKECQDVIVNAKKVQADRANKAALDLIAMLEKEEEAAKTKKTKQDKKKEKKKEAKKEKKGTSKEASKENNAPVVETMQADESDDDSSEIAPLPKQQVAIIDNGVPKPIVKAKTTVPTDDRVPTTVTEASKIVEEQKAKAIREKETTTTSSATKQAASRQKSRRHRNESGPSAAAAATSLNTTPISLEVSSPITSVTVAGRVTPQLSPAVRAMQQQQPEEWTKASAKKRQTKSSKSSAVTVAAAAAQKDYYLDDNGAYGGWKDVELSRRRANTLTVCSTVIARVIGRGGANINAIREATGASIEVEKQNAKKDQLDRLISIRGTSETVRNATLMINGLIGEPELSVTDIIRQVLRGNSSVASSVSSEGGSSRLGSVCEPSSVHKTATVVAPQSRATGAANAAAAGSGAAPAPQTNVWQQRMAARQQQIQQQTAVKEPSPRAPSRPSAAASVSPSPAPPSPEPTATAASASEPVASPPPTSQTPAAVASSIPTPVVVQAASKPDVSSSLPPPAGPGAIGQPITKSQVATSAATSSSFAPAPLGIVDSSSPSAELKRSSSAAPDVVSSEEELRKAPGYRPIGSATPQQNVATVAPIELRTTVPSSSVNESAFRSSFLGDLTSNVSSSFPLAPGIISKQGSSDSMLTTPTSMQKDMPSFIDENKLAEIWGGTSSAEPAWGGQVILDSFGGLSLNGQAPWSNFSAEGLIPQNNMDHAAPPTPKLVSPPMSMQQQQPIVSSPYQPQMEWSNATSMPPQQQQSKQAPIMFPRPQTVQNLRSTPVPQMPPVLSQRATSFSTSQQPNANLFNQLAAQLINHHQGGMSGPPVPSGAPPPNNYYPSPSYTDPGMLGLASHTPQPPPGHMKNYANQYQAAAQEFESLNNLLSSSTAFGQPPQSQQQAQPPMLPNGVGTYGSATVEVRSTSGGLMNSRGVVGATSGSGVGGSALGSSGAPGASSSSAAGGAGPSSHRGLSQQPPHLSHPHLAAHHLQEHPLGKPQQQSTKTAPAGAFPPSPSLNRSLSMSAARGVQPNFAPPPGFGIPTGAGSQANTSIPPPPPQSMHHPFFNMPPPNAAPPPHGSAFNAYNGQNANWLNNAPKPPNAGNSQQPQPQISWGGWN